MQQRRPVLGKLETWSAALMLANGALGLMVPCSVAVLHRSAAALMAAPPWTSLLGVLAGLLALRGKMAGLAAGVLFYGLQIVSYYARDVSVHFGSGLGWAAVIDLPQGTMVVNLAALAGLAVIVLILVRRCPRRAYLS